MTTNRSWNHFPPTYRAHEVSIVADWIIRGVSGSVAGLPGVGKSNFLGFLCHRPEIIQALLTPHQIKATLIPIDLNNLPDETVVTFYRVILRCFYEVRDHLDAGLQQAVISSYQENKAVQDPFLVQSVLRELLGQFRRENIRVRRNSFCA